MLCFCQRVLWRAKEGCLQAALPGQPRTIKSGDSMPVAGRRQEVKKETRLDFSARLAFLSDHNLLFLAPSPFRFHRLNSRDP